MLEYKYTGFGTLISNSSNYEGIAKDLFESNIYIYKGYCYDVETNLFLVTSRYYSPELGRFIQPSDVSSLNRSSINGLNLYSYANNNPIGIAYSSSGFAVSANGGMVKSIDLSVGGGSMSGSGFGGSTSIPRNMPPVPGWLKIASSISDPLTSFVGPIRTAIYAFTTTGLWDLMRLDGVDELPGKLSKSMKIAGYGLAIFNAGVVGYEKYASGASNISALAGAGINACIGIGSIHVATLAGSFAVGLLSATALSGGWIILLSAGAAFLVGTAANHLLTKLEIGGNTIEGHLNNFVDWLIWWD